MRSKINYDEIVIFKGIAIIGLLVLHIHPPLINAAMTHALKNAVSHYSMEIFMFSSGFLFGISKLKISSFADYYALVVKKFKRLMVPYFVISGIILLLKFITQQFVTLLHPVEHDFWRHLLFNPVSGFNTFLWFLYILFFVFLIFPVFLKIFHNSLVLYLIILTLYLIPLPEFSYFNHYLLRWGLLFFCSGYLFSRCKLESINVYSLYLCIFLFVLVVSLISQKELIMDFMQILIGYKLADNMLKLLVVLMGTFSFYCLSGVLKKYKNPLSQMLKYLGTNSASIYLLHTISISSVRIICIDILGFKESLFPLISIIIFISGIMFPVLIVKHIINKFDLLPPLILGVKKLS